MTRGGALDALRFLAAFFMVIHHYANEAPTPLAELHPVFERGYLATDFFLIVSGYVMGRVYGDRVADGRVKTGQFFLRRAGRVIPAHLMMSAAFVLAVVFAALIGVKPLHPEWFDWNELPGQVVLIQAWGPYGGKGWNAPTWTLSALLACYFAFPLVWRILRPIKSAVIALAVGVLGLAGADILTQTLLGYPIYQMPMQYGVIRAAPLFLLGVTLALCSEIAMIPARPAAVLGLVSLASLIGLQLVGRFDFLSLTLIALVVLSAGAVPTPRPSRLLEKAALVSFAVFITNEFVRVIYFGVDHALGARLGFSRSVEWLIWFGGPAAAVLFAVAFHFLIDWPSQAWIKAWLTETPGRWKRRLAASLPAPDPDFDPWDVDDRSPKVREIVLQIGPMRGSVRGGGPQRSGDLGWG